MGGEMQEVEELASELEETRRKNAELLWKLKQSQLEFEKNKQQLDAAQEQIHSLQENIEQLRLSMSAREATMAREAQKSEERCCLLNAENLQLAAERQKLVKEVAEKSEEIETLKADIQAVATQFELSLTQKANLDEVLMQNTTLYNEALKENQQIRQRLQQS